MSKCILILGGARSGKSHYAQELGIKTGKPALFVATAEAGDEEMRRRIEAHRKARPSGWRTLEAQTRIGPRIKQELHSAPTVIIDCVTLLVNNILMECGGKGEEIDAQVAEKAVVAEIEGLLRCMETSSATFIIVSNEVGLGLVPANAIGRLYRDLLGKANQMLAQHADEAYLMVAGIPLRIKPKP